ncbi:Gfo/Idh/MocA family protein [Caballeronia sordidicola]|uniref:Glucose-fructose oxidoreductase n=1 Tax=Caballeronia sordidicola TaxID=196367 RepID=A0A242M6Z9_CABSO|nr:Gfo/Idh/MocA family oxidoreductase [Caballeronia sordidicola]OTP67039.1 glucose-fructose oxidoreductase [Caballeronia sordidicola]
MSVPNQDHPEERPPFVAASERRASPKDPPLAPGQRVGFAVIGLGRLSLDSILPALASCKLCKLAAVMTGNKEKGRRVAAQYGVLADAVYAYDEWDKLAHNADVQAVYIVTPNGMHHEQVIQAARIGKHVLCEKPLSNTSAEALEMVEACADAGVKLMVAYRLHMSRTIATSRKWCARVNSASSRSLKRTTARCRMTQASGVTKRSSRAAVHCLTSDFTA